MTWQNGDCLQNGKYLILEELGEGGFGITYKAKHTHLNQFVVIKTPNDSLKNDPNYPRFVERFIEEGRKLASLSEKKHPHIVRATDLFFEGTLPCLAMDFVEGKDLFKIVEKKPLSEAKALEYIRQIGDALCVVHGEGMVHRDAHPANIMVKPDGNAVLIDFGLAADVAAAIPSSQHPANRGFAPYEQMQGNGLPMVDVYTLAATLYFIVTRRPPTTAIDRKLNNMALPEPKSFNSSISKELNSAILKGMQLEARNRPQSMRAWLKLLPNSQVTISDPPRFPVALILLVLAIGGGGFYLWQNFKPSTSLTPLASPSIPVLDKNKEAQDWGERGLVKLMRQDYKGAIAAHTEAIRIDPNSAADYGARGFSKFKLADYQGAITDYTEAIRLGTVLKDRTYYQRGNAKEELGDMNGAIADYTEAIRLNPKYAMAYGLRGTLKYRLGDKQGAISDLNETIRFKADFDIAYFTRGSAKFSLGDNQGAIADYNEFIRLKPDAAIAYSSRGSVKYKLGDSQGAIADYNEAIRLKPDYADAYSFRGEVKQKSGDIQGAIADWNEAIRLKPNDADLYNNRGLAKSSLSDREGAISDWNTAIRLKPDHSLAYSNRGATKYELGDKQGARIDLQKAADLYKQQGNIEKYNLIIKAIETVPW